MKTRTIQYLILFSAAFCMTLTAQQKPAAQPFDMAGAFPAKVQSFPLYGDGAIPNSKPGPDQETGTNSGWVQKVSRPTIEVYLPAKVKGHWGRSARLPRRWVCRPDLGVRGRAVVGVFSSITGSRHLW